MTKYFKCECGVSFERWFKSISEAKKEKGSVVCPACKSTRVVSQIKAPLLDRSVYQLTK